MEKKPKIIIIGAGFGGLSALLSLIKSKLELDIKIFDKDNHFEYTPSMHLGFTNTNYLKKITFPLKKYYGNYFINKEIIKISKNFIITNDNKKYGFDYLVVASGSRANYYGNESYEKFGQVLRRKSDALLLNKRLKTANSVTVVGGGYTGVEITAILATETDKQINLVHTSGRLIDTLSEKISKLTEIYLKKKNVNIIFNERAETFTKNHCKLASGKKVKSDLIIFSAGITTNDKFYEGKPDLNLDLSLKENSKIFFIGDVGRSGVLATAHNAMIEGRHVADVLLNKIKGTKNYKAPKHRNWTILAIALGSKDGILTIGNKGFSFPLLTGFSKWLIERRVMFEFKYKIQLPI